MDVFIFWFPVILCLGLIGRLGYWVYSRSIETPKLVYPKTDAHVKMIKPLPPIPVNNSTLKPKTRFPFIASLFKSTTKVEELSTKELPIDDVTPESELEYDQVVDQLNEELIDQLNEDLDENLIDQLNDDLDDDLGHQSDDHLDGQLPKLEDYQQIESGITQNNEASAQQEGLRKRLSGRWSPEGKLFRVFQRSSSLPSTPPSPSLPISSSPPPPTPFDDLDLDQDSDQNISPKPTRWAKIKDTLF